MFKRNLIFTLILIVAVVLGGCKKKEKIEQSYISDLEKEYNLSEIDSPSITNQTNVINVIVETPKEEKTYAPVVPQNKAPAQKRAPIKPKLQKKTVTYKQIYPWVDTKDSKEIKKTRDLIAREKYREAKEYVDSLDIENLRDTDIGHLYQFRGIICYFLVSEDSNQFAEAIGYFEEAFNTTKIAKFEPLSLLWLGMLYEQYSYNEEELYTAISIFDRIINEYSTSRFVNDAIFYKILVMKKLDKNPYEYSDLQTSLQQGKFVDDYIYSKWHKDYVKKNVIINRIK